MLNQWKPIKFALQEGDDLLSTWDQPRRQAWAMVRNRPGWGSIQQEYAGGSKPINTNILVG
jgi:hypothetical protein